MNDSALASRAAGDGRHTDTVLRPETGLGYGWPSVGDVELVVDVIDAAGHPGISAPPGAIPGRYEPTGWPR